jgi:glycosyltransferase involved in cell wall biosynthesis
MSERSAKVFVHAPNVHQGGGKSLLTALLNLFPGDLKILAQLDSRMTLPANMPENLTIKFVEPSVLQRLRAEWWLMQNVHPQDAVLCFGNLPPLFKLQGQVTVFVQNRYLVDRVALGNFPIKTRLRLILERLWLSGRAANADEFVVQTPSMKTALLSSGCVVKQPVHVRPFANMSVSYQRTVNHQNAWQEEHKRYDFIYAASGEPHKNHRRLIEAWCFLAEQGLFPSLCLTVDEDVSPNLCAWIGEQKLHYGLKLESVGFIPHDQVRQLYTQAGALIYPSTFESFGLPLIEARQAGLPVLASELDYVRDVLDPEQAFDPESPLSIARAVKRFMGLNDEPLPLLNAADFMKSILEKCK